MGPGGMGGGGDGYSGAGVALKPLKDANGKEVPPDFAAPLSEFVVQFVDTPRDSLVKYHPLLGRMVRNEFKMWEDYWTPEIINGVDVSPDHPDQRSQRVIEQTWEQLQ